MQNFISVLLQTCGLIILSTGGYRFGKSACAENLLEQDRQKNIAFVLIAIGMLMSFAALTSLVV